MKKHLVILLATGCYSGYMRPFSGTWGTIPAWAIAYFLLCGNWMLTVPVALVTFFISVWSANEAEKMFGHDDKKIVIDEWAGMFVTVMLLPVTLTNFAIAFVTFRLFDVIKLYPAAQFEKLPGGWGITMDDIAAGVYAGIVTHLIVYFLQGSAF